MKVNEFIEKLKYLETLPTTYYSVAGGDWAKWNGYTWNFDCVIMVKAILWGWCEDYNAPHGGAIYGSNGVYDDGTEQIIERCYDKTNDFTNINPGELLWMPGHVGVYVGDRKVIECTAAWENKVLYSELGYNGERIRNGSHIYNWQKHGKLPYVDYNAPISTETNINDKSIEELANEVIEGKYGNGDDRVKALGDRYNEVQALVNEMLAPKVDILDLVKKTIRGDFGNGDDRRNNLGSNYDEVQNQVNLNYQNETTNWDNIRLY